MSIAIVYDENNKITNVNLTADPADYAGQQALIFNDQTPGGMDTYNSVANLLNTIPQKYLVQENGLIREMTDEEKTVVDSSESDAQQEASDQALADYMSDPKTQALIQWIIDNLNQIRGNPVVQMDTLDVSTETTTLSQSTRQIQIGKGGGIKLPPAQIQ